MTESEGIKLLKGRRSIRSYESTPIPDDILTEILETSRWCYSAVNKQPWRFIVIRNKEMIQNVAKECTSGPFTASAPVLVALIGDTKQHWYVQDNSFMTLQLALAAWSFGIGTCYIGIINRDNLKKILELKEREELITVMPLGYPKGEIPAALKRKSLERQVKYID